MPIQLIGPLSPSTTPIRLPVCGQASCGFPSPAADYSVPDLSLDDLVGITATSSIFLMRAWGDSMRGCGIYDADVLVVDKGKTARPGDIIVAVIGAEFVVKRLVLDAHGQPQLLAENPDYSPIKFGDAETFEVWAVCVWVLHNLRGI
jgi:DNA polymerase V